LIVRPEKPVEYSSGKICERKLRGQLSDAIKYEMLGYDLGVARTQIATSAGRVIPCKH
jgi:hypothetical protein